MARAAGLTAAELGLARADFGSGARAGAIAIGVIAGIIAVAAAVATVVPGLPDLLDDDRVNVPLSGLLFETLVQTPLGTVALEELAFRGVLLALLLRRLPPVPSTAVCSALFGLWHVMPTLGTATQNAGVADSAATPSGLALIVGANVLATAAAGAVFCWLRLRSRSLLAPALAHLGVNDTAFVAGWIANR